MLVSHRHRFIYLKSLKTAGTSVEIFLEPHCHWPEPWPGPAHDRPAAVTRDGIIGARGGPAFRGSSPWYNHMPAAELRRALGEAAWSGYWKFCNVRNPYDRAVSAFWFTCATELAALGPEAPFAAIRARFAAWVGEGRPILDNSRFYVLERRFALDAVLRFERLEADLAAAVAHLGLPSAPHPLARHKATQRRRPEPWQEYFDAPTARRIEAIAAADFDLFGYERLSA